MLNRMTPLRLSFLLTLAAKEGLARPNKHHGRDLLELADSMALGHLFTDNGDRASRWR